VSRFRQLLRLALGLPSFLRRVTTPEGARAEIRARMERREERFLETTRRLVYDEPASPYRRLLERAGCAHRDLAAAVRQHGVEGALERLRASGVFVSWQEFKSLVPIRRDGLEIATRPSDFDNPVLMGRGFGGTTSGSRAAPRRVKYDLDLIAEHAANESLLQEIHGVSRSPLALWLPSLPALSGLNNVLMNARLGRPPERWFTPSARAAAGESRAALAYVSWCSRLLGRRLPRAEPTPPSSAGRVARWLAEARGRGPGVVRTYTSLAVRVAEAARADGIDLAGSVLFAGAEPLTERRRAYIESTGATVVSRYTATETGLLGGACTRRRGADDMHLYTDRLAVVAGPRNALLFTSLSPTTGKVLFNTDIGDTGTLARAPCDCAFGELGMTVRVAGVRPVDQVAAEGVPFARIEESVGGVVERAGGSPADYLVRELPDERGTLRLHLVVSDRLTGLADKDLRAALPAELDPLLFRADPERHEAHKLFHTWGH
jgi:hypothetical protein